MPSSAPSACEHPGCCRVARQGRRCDVHRRERDAAAASVRREAHRDYNARRPESDRFYGSTAWRKCRDAFIAEHPLCVECERHNVLTVAAVVDHVVPYKSRPDLGLDWNNLRPLCAACHSRIGARVVARQKTDAMDRAGVVKTEQFERIERIG